MQNPFLIPGEMGFEYYNEKGIDMTEHHSKSTEMDREFDIIDELKTALSDIDEALEQSKTEELPDKVSYLRALVDDLDDVLSGEYEGLRRKRFIIKRTE